MKRLKINFCDKQGKYIPTTHPTKNHFLLDTKTGRRGDKKINKTRDKRESNPSHHKRSHRFIDKERTLSIDTGESTLTVLPIEVHQIVDRQWKDKNGRL